MNNMRIGGLASGMDIDTIVKDLMKAERMPLDKLNQKKQILEWQREDLREINKLFLGFRNEIFNMRLQSTFQVKSASSTNESKISATASTIASGTFTITSAQKATSAYNISGGSDPNVGKISGGTKIDSKKRLYEIKDHFAGKNDINWDTYKEVVQVKSDTTTVQLDKTQLDSISGPTITVKDKTGATTTFNVVQGTDANPSVLATDVYINTETGQMTFGSTVTAGSTFDISYDFTQKETKNVTGEESIFFLNNGYVRSGSLPATIEVKDADGNIVKTFTVESGTEAEPTVASDKVYVNTETGKLTFGTELSDGQSFDVNYKYHYFTTSMSTYDKAGNKNTQTFEVKGTQSLDEFFLGLNGSELGVSAFYDEYTDKVIINRKETGNFNTAGKEILFDGDSFMTKVLNFDENNELGGDDAIFTINGLETQRHSNTFEFNGVTITIKEDIKATDTPVSITVNNNTDKVFENIKNFVDKYNELVLKMNEKLAEPRYSKYQPLTEEQKAELSETQIEKWEEKARSGLLKGEPILTNVLSSMRNDFASTISGLSEEFNSMFDIGLSTGSYETRGRIIIDEDKLKQALADNPDKVMKIFTNKDSEFASQGIANRLYNSVDKALKKLGDKAGSPLSLSKVDNSLLGKSISDMDRRIERFEDRLTQIEDRYWRQFTAMEQAIQRANQQSAFFAQQFGG